MGLNSKPSRLPIYSPDRTPVRLGNNRLGRNGKLTQNSKTLSIIKPGDSPFRNEKMKAIPVATGHSEEFKAKEESIFKRFSDKEGYAPRTEISTMLRSLGFYPTEKQVGKLLEKEEKINFKKFQTIVIQIEDIELKVEET